MRNVPSFLALILLVLPAWPLLAQREPVPPVEARPGRRPALQPRMGPWNRDLQLLRSTDGKAFRPDGLFVERAGVPCLARDKQGRLIAVFQWFPLDRREAFDRIAVRFSDDDGRTWTDPQRVEFADLPEEYARQFDPTLVPLEDGRFRLYFTSSRGREPGQENTAIYSAVSSDAVHFTFEPEARFAAAEENVVDCAVTQLAGTWHLYAPLPRQEGRAYHATSKDGLKFERQPDVSVPSPGTWIGNVINQDGTLRFYGSGREGVWSASSRDGSAWLAEDTSGARGGDPAVVRTKSGDYLMVVTGDLRPDAPMEPPWQRGLVRAPAPGAGEAPRGRAPEPGMAAPDNSTAMTVADGYLYILRDGVVYQFGARDLNFIRQTPLPDPRRLQRPPGGNAPEDREPPVRPRP